MLTFLAETNQRLTRIEQHLGLEPLALSEPTSDASPRVSVEQAGNQMANQLRHLAVRAKQDARGGDVKLTRREADVFEQLVVAWERATETV